MLRKDASLLHSEQQLCESIDGLLARFAQKLPRQCLDEVLSEVAALLSLDTSAADRTVPSKPTNVVNYR
mgnify:CR=1 FL=1|jgi:hypothetical protein